MSLNKLLFLILITKINFKLTNSSNEDPGSLEKDPWNIDYKNEKFKRNSETGPELLDLETENLRNEGMRISAMGTDPAQPEASSGDENNEFDVVLTKDFDGTNKTEKYVHYGEFFLSMGVTILSLNSNRKFFFLQFF